MISFSSNNARAEAVVQRDCLFRAIARQWFLPDRQQYDNFLQTARREGQLISIATSLPVALNWLLVLAFARWRWQSPKPCLYHLHRMQRNWPAHPVCRWFLCWCQHALQGRQTTACAPHPLKGSLAKCYGWMNILFSFVCRIGLASHRLAVFLYLRFVGTSH